MGEMKSNLIQVAGVQDAAEAEMLLATGVDWLGFPFRLAHHQEDLTEADAAEIIRLFHLKDRAVVITYLNSADEIVQLCQKLGLSKVQLHGKIARQELEKLRKFYSELFLIKSLIVGGEEPVFSLIGEFTLLVDAFITDTFDAGTGACGATGRVHDWQISRKIVVQSPRPVILAGGLNPQNVGRAIQQVQPAGVDAHTGLEDGAGRKDPVLVKAFVTEARAAFAAFDV